MFGSKLLSIALRGRVSTVTDHAVMRYDHSCICMCLSGACAIRPLVNLPNFREQAMPTFPSQKGQNGRKYSNWIYRFKLCYNIVRRFANDSAISHLKMIFYLFDSDVEQDCFHVVCSLHIARHGCMHCHP